MSPWEHEQIRRGRAQLSDKQFNWQRQSHNPSSYDIWLKDAHNIWLDERRGISVMPEAHLVTPPMAVSIWSKFISFLKGFKKIAP